VVKFTKQSPVRGLLRKTFVDTERRKPVKNTELALTQSLIRDSARRSTGEAAGLADQFSGLARANVGRRQDKLQTFVAVQCCKPPTRRASLFESPARQGNVDIAQVYNDLVAPGLIGCIASEIAMAWPMPHQPQFLRPVLTHQWILLAVLAL
jgi:hypothetical protein